MTWMPKPAVRHPALPKNALGLTRRDYEGRISTLCAGCGHDSISSALIQACYDLELPPHRIAKLSGIGCSAKTPTYFIGAAHGFNGVHGRMPSLATGAALANRDLVYIGISGDGDTASIGLGQFVHAIRRGVNMLYMVENNGTYGLTKGQFSATADVGSTSKGGEANPYAPIDLVRLALDMGAGFVARSFSGDKEQLVPLLRAALRYPGFAYIDCLSPCVTFNNHEGSTKSYPYIREHGIEIADLVEPREEIEVSYAPGERKAVTLLDGSQWVLRKLDGNYNPGDRRAALELLESHRRRGEIPTGLLYLDRDGKDMHAYLNTVATPLNALDFAALCPGSAALETINARLR
ncbi:MAG TPA: 2-oxoacid:ferredoxin oxidoreductase subunit beta [Gammaproteobacteria bacterium]|nr:2-oxoacid:ferredoxin oxidoreductase subunit beta [Gammaproteobacteria bacterium]